MFERLLKNKKYLFSYLLSLGISLSTPLFGTMPFMTSYFGALVNNQIPVLVPFVLMLIITAIRFGTVGITKFVVTAIVFAIFTSYKKSNDDFNKIIKILVASVISTVILFITKQVAINMLPQLVLETILVLIFYLVFTLGLKVLIEKPKEEIKQEELISSGIVALVVFSGFYHPIAYGISIFSLISVITLMIITWKKPVLFGIITSLFLASLFIALQNEALTYLMLFAIIAIVTTLLSRAGKKGAMIGLVFTLVYSLIYSINQQNTYNNFGMNERLLQDYAQFVENRENSGNKANISGEINDFNEKEWIEGVKKSAKPSASSVVLKEMAIGFILLLLLPESALPTKVTSNDFKNLFKKAFPNNKVLRLNPGNTKNSKPRGKN